MKIQILGHAALLVSMSLGCGSKTSSSRLQEAWNIANDPLNLSVDYERSFNHLPLEGHLETVPWADSYWPSYRGGIAQRWKEDTDAFNYKVRSRRQVQSMSLAELARLSPAEKYDIFVGQYDYPTVTRERHRTSASNAHWEGICHGWAAASLLFVEPHAVLLKGKFGIKVPFGATDVKALLSYYQGELSDAVTQNLGQRCYDNLETTPDSEHSSPCRDVNAGAFHVVLSNQLGLWKKGFVADITRDQQVWNQPISGFVSQILGRQDASAGAAPGTVSEVIVHTQMSYVEENDPTWDIDAVSGSYERLEEYDYRLELDANDVVIGGEWLSYKRPDFLWIQEKPTFSGYFSALATIAERAVSDPELPDPTR